MGIFENKFVRRLTIAKSLGFIIWLIAFFVIPYAFKESSLELRLAVLFWYTTVGAMIGLMWIMDKHPVLNWFKMPWCFRWIFLWAWFNLVLVLFIFPILTTIMTGSAFEWYSPYWLVLEWAIVWFIIDWIATKFAWEWKEICEIK